MFPEIHYVLTKIHAGFAETRKDIYPRAPAPRLFDRLSYVGEHARDAADVIATLIKYSLYPLVRQLPQEADRLLATYQLLSPIAHGHDHEGWWKTLWHAAMLGTCARQAHPRALYETDIAFQGPSDTGEGKRPLPNAYATASTFQHGVGRLFMLAAHTMSSSSLWRRTVNRVRRAALRGRKNHMDVLIHALAASAYRPDLPAHVERVTQAIATVTTHLDTQSHALGKAFDALCCTVGEEDVFCSTILPEQRFLSAWTRWNIPAGSYMLPLLATLREAMHPVHPQSRYQGLQAMAGFVAPQIVPELMQDHARQARIFYGALWSQKFDLPWASNRTPADEIDISDASTSLKTGYALASTGTYNDIIRGLGYHIAAERSAMNEFAAVGQRFASILQHHIRKKGAAWVLGHLDLDGKGEEAHHAEDAQHIVKAVLALDPTAAQLLIEGMQMFATTLQTFIGTVTRAAPHHPAPYRHAGQQETLPIPTHG